MKKKRNYFFVFAALILSAFSCRNGDANRQTSFVNDSLNYISFPEDQAFLSDWSKNNTVVFHLSHEPDNLHPSNGNTAMRQHLFQYTQRFLVTTDMKKLEIRPDLVRNMPEVSKDYLSLTFHLYAGIKWEDGSPLTAEDVVFTFKANKCTFTNNGTYRQALENLENIIIEEKDSLKFTVKMKRKYLQNINLFTDYPIMQRRFFDPKNVLSNYSFAALDDSNFTKKPLENLKAWANNFNHPKYGFQSEYLRGLGPYKVSSWEKGQQIVLEKKIKGRYPDKIIFKLNRDVNSTILEFKSQILDGSISLSASTLNQLSQDSAFRKNYNFGVVQIFAYSYLAFNMKADGAKHKNFFSDKLTRKALAYLTPVDRINKLIFYGKGKRISGPVYPSSKEYNNTLALIPLDIEKAEVLLAQAGWKDTDGDGVLEKLIDGKRTSFVFDLSYIATPAQKDMCLLIAESYKSAGIKVNLRSMDVGAFLENAWNHDFDMLSSAWSESFAPTDFSQFWHSKSWINHGSNFSGFGNSSSDSLIDSINTIMSIEERIAPSKRLQQMVYDEQPYIFLIQQTSRIVAHKRFGNVQLFKHYPGVMINEWKLRK